MVAGREAGGCGDSAERRGGCGGEKSRRGGDWKGEMCVTLTSFATNLSRFINLRSSN